MPAAKRVIQILRRFSPDQWGSNEQIALNASIALKQHGIVSSIFTTSEQAHLLNNQASKINNKIDVRYFNYFYPYLFLTEEHKQQLDLKGGNPYSISMAHALLHEDYQLIHCHSHSRLAAAARFIALKRNIPYIVSFSSWQQNLPKEIANELNTLSKRLGGFGKVIDMLTQPKRVVRDASGILCASFQDYQLVKKTYPLTPSLYLPGAVEFEAMHALEEELPLIASKDGVKKQLLCVGRIDSQKNQALLIELMNKLKELAPGRYHLNLVGHIANKQYFDSLQQKIKRYELGEQVSFHTHIQPNSRELLAFYQHSDVFISSAIHEPFCLTILEAWYAGLPVLAANIDSIKSMVQHKLTGLLFNPYEVESLCLELLALEASDTLKQKLIQHAKIHVEQHHSWAAYGEKLKQFYNEVDSWYKSQHCHSISSKRQPHHPTLNTKESHCE